MGCCLETKVPFLVYEFFPNGTLYERLYDQGQSLGFFWQLRLQITTQTTKALKYLHSDTSPSIIHRDVKSANILLDHVRQMASFMGGLN